MFDFKERIDALAALMEEYRLTEAALEDGPFRVAFRRHATLVAATPASTETQFVEEEVSEAVPVAAAPVGTPVTTPMGGIFYDAPSPTSAPFVREGDVIAAGQIVGLIEAMKVFNEIPSSLSGTVRRIVAEPGSVVSLGDTLLLVG